MIELLPRSTPTGPVAAPFAVLVDAISFAVSALMLAGVREPETRPAQVASSGGLRATLTDGLRMIFRDRVLRPIVLAGLFVALFENAMVALYVLYATSDLGLNAAVVGIIFVAGGLGAVPGATLTTWAGNRFGLGPALIGGLMLSAPAALLVPLASGPVVVVVVMLAASKALAALTFTVANILQWSLRQAVTPDEYAGRVTAGQRLVVYGGGALGGLLGGALGGWIGLRPALYLLVLGSVLAPLWIVFSPVRSLREQPEAPDPERQEEAAASS